MGKTAAERRREGAQKTALPLHARLTFGKKLLACRSTERPFSNQVTGVAVFFAFVVYLLGRLVRPLVSHNEGLNGLNSRIQPARRGTCPNKTQRYALATEPPSSPLSPGDTPIW